MDYREFTCAVEKQMNLKMEGGITARLYNAVKNNGTERTGILVEAPGVNISPTIYLEEYFTCYQNGDSVEKIVEDILGFYRNVRQVKSWDYEKILTYEGVKSRIVFKLINTIQNQRFLEKVPHMDFLDLSIVFYVLLDVTDEGTASMSVTMDHIKQWNVSKDQLWNDACENVKSLLPAEFFTMNYAIKEMLRKGMGVQENQDGSENLFLRESDTRDGMYVLSNNLRNYGASCIAYPHILDVIWGILQKDFYVLPSSVHEVIITPCQSTVHCSDLDEMIRDINRTQLEPEEILSDHAYLYERSTGVLCIGEKCVAGKEAL